MSVGNGDLPQGLLPRLRPRAGPFPVHPPIDLGWWTVWYRV
jgi:hypothetical protein